MEATVRTRVVGLPAFRGQLAKTSEPPLTALRHAVSLSGVRNTCRINLPNLPLASVTLRRYCYESQQVTHVKPQTTGPVGYPQLILVRVQLGEQRKTSSEAVSEVIGTAFAAVAGRGTAAGCPVD